MLYSKGLKEITSIYKGNKAIITIYRGTRTIWSSILNCYTSFWNNIKVWTNNNYWKNIN